ncbi:hypothetical protein AJ80_06586 [Polytolypa hystricis UAMH7299]|uniref:Uncharacterized protein n=1 Tax=Polytolypa hystricis (strain UAMH7299) TaxID=1447883 RepID=A0A2B7XVW0_POLH7|nr:hypothetical protein AJ80_06586 [Polytolypa hystricis UAMH7299]
MSSLTLNPLNLSIIPEKKRKTKSMLFPQLPQLKTNQSQISLFSSSPKNGEAKQKNKAKQQKSKSDDLPKPGNTPKVEIVKSMLQVNMPMLEQSTLRSSFQWMQRGPVEKNPRQDIPMMDDTISIMPDHPEAQSPSRTTGSSPSISPDPSSSDYSLVEAPQPLRSQHEQALSSFGISVGSENPHMPPMMAISRPLTPVLPPTATLSKSCTDLRRSLTVSPVLSTSTHQVSPPESCKGLKRGPSIATQMSVVSPLTVEFSPSRTSVAAVFDSMVEEVGGRRSADTHKSADSSASDDTKRDSVSSFYEEASSRSSFEIGDDAESKFIRRRSLTSRSPKAYSIISPVSAGVFDNRPDLKRAPTFKKKFSIHQSRNKPLPPEPPVPMPRPLAQRVKTIRSNQVAHIVKISKAPKQQPQFLPHNPRQSDLDSLDEAFRRSGLVGSRYSFSTRASSPSLRKATRDLEVHLHKKFLPLAMSSSYSISKPSGRDRDRDRDMKSQHHESTKSPQKASATKLSHRQSIDSALARMRSTHGADKSTGLSHFSLSRKTLRRKKSDKSLKISAPVETEQVSTPSTPCILIEEASQSASAAQEPLSPGFGERNLRMKLPRLRTTQLSHKPVIAPVNLSMIMESPGDHGDDRTADSLASAEQKILAALEGLGQIDIPSQSSTSALPSSNYSPQRTALSDAPSYPSSEEHVITELYRYYASTGQLESASEEPPVVHEQLVEEQLHAIPSLVAENILLRILQSVDHLEDLFSLARLNRAFYSVYKANELDLMKRTLFRMSPAAWELREMSPPWEHEEHEIAELDIPVPEYTPNLYIRHYTRDLFTMVALKSLILVRCENFLRPDTVRALAGLDEARSEEVDEAFWRVWSFCRIFGCGKGREEDITAQADWLSGGRLAEAESRGGSMALSYPFGVNSVLFDPPFGFSKGNSGGLSSKQLYDMMEIWTCLGVLLQVFHGKCKEARAVGIFDNSDIEAGNIAEDALLEGWTQYILTLGPSAILTIISINPASPIESMFSRAQSLGWTNWSTPQTQGGSRRYFLREAISRVYENQLATGEIPSIFLRSGRTSMRPTRSPSPQHPGSSPGSSVSRQETSATRQRQASMAEELRRKRAETGQDSENGAPSTCNSAASGHDADVKTLSVVGHHHHHHHHQHGFLDERPISNFSEVMHRLDGTAISATTATSIQDARRSQYASPRPHPATFSSPPIPQVTIEPPPPTSTSSPPPQPTDAPPRVPTPTPEPIIEEKISRGRYPAHTSEVLDPADMAMHKMVNELGFSEQDAKWALKCTDTGESLDVDAAVRLLMERGGRLGIDASTTLPTRSQSMIAHGERGPDNVWRPVWRWA